MNNIEAAIAAMVTPINQVDSLATLINTLSGNVTSC